MKFKEDRPFANPEVAEQELLELGANAMEADHAGLLAVEIINRQFRDAGGSYEEYSAAANSAEEARAMLLALPLFRGSRSSP